MRPWRWITVVAACSLLATGCIVTSETVTEVASVQSSTVVIESGLDAIAAAEGEPHILWFWGAN